ncbi:hypothetical protein JCM10908_004529 [Rhodotorula pacifica]|uniref:uncharacterized protein n=1 Tax=Rhodotorula pacifica TaxID=1495444 RepID=UPI00316CDAA6
MSVAAADSPPPPSPLDNLASPAARLQPVDQHEHFKRPRVPHRSASYQRRASPSLGYSTLTTRSSSLSRLSLDDRALDGAGTITPAKGSSSLSQRTAGVGCTGGHYDMDAYAAWRRSGKEHTLLARARKAAGDAGDFSSPSSASSSSLQPSARRRDKGKGKERAAVAFVVGIPSSSEDGATDSDGASEFGRNENGRQDTPGPTIEDIIRFQIRQPVQQVDPRDLDSLLPYGIGDYTFVQHSPSSSSVPPTPSSSRSLPLPSDAPRRGSVPSVEEPAAPQKVVLGRGKFSQVLLARKDGIEYALKHTPLYVHHHLISARLLREPEILSQLTPHPNLIKVFETVRTPGHFYLVEENLQSSVTLEALVEASPGGILPVDSAWAVLEQLCDVVRSLHEPPVKVCHRDIKPENVLVRVVPPPSSAPPDTLPSLHLRLLDFGLATHFSSSSPQLATCCGSPAYHSPEIWRGLRDRNSSSSKAYWGPEVDVWCVGLTVLRCLVPERYPLGIGHTSLQSLADKVVTALLQVKDALIRQVLATFLQLDGVKRMQAFDRFCDKLPTRLEDRAEREGRPSRRRRPAENGSEQPRTFKSTSFISSPLEHRLDLLLDEASSARDGWPQLAATAVEAEEGASSQYRFPGTRISRSTSSKRTITGEDGGEGTPRGAECLSRDSSVSRNGRAERVEEAAAPSRAWRPSLSLLDLSNMVDGTASPAISPVPSVESLSLRHPVFLPPIELVLLNPSNEPIRRAVSYIKYALRSKGILYHVRDDEMASHRLSISSASPSTESQPPSLPPTPLLQPRPVRQYTDSPASISSPLPFAAEESYTCYLHCVVALPSPSAATPSVAAIVTSPPDASSRLRAALKRSSTPVPTPQPNARNPALSGPRSASTPPPVESARTDDRGRKPARKGEQPKPLVEALTFFLSIRRRGRDAKGRRAIVITLSDQRAVPFVRDALVPPGDALTSDSSQDEGQRGRAAVPGTTKKVKSPDDNSGSRDARARRATASSKRHSSVAPSAGGRANGLGLEMGQPAANGSSSAVQPAGWDFALPGWVERLVGHSSASQRESIGA